MVKQAQLLDLMGIGESIANTVQFYKVDEELNEDDLARIRETIREMAKYCGVVGVREVQALLEQHSEPPANRAMFDFLLDAFINAIDEQLVVVLDRGSRSLYQATDLFGADVSVAFPSSEPEIRDGGTCLALGQHTAAVFHFLRALEPPIKALGLEFGIVKFTDWNSALNDIEDAVRDRTNPQKRPNWTDEKDDYTEMVTHLFLVKNAWRNYTMHLKLRHTDEEAREVMAATKSFMKRAAKRVKE